MESDNSIILLTERQMAVYWTAIKNGVRGTKELPVGCLLKARSPSAPATDGEWTYQFTPPLNAQTLSCTSLNAMLQIEFEGDRIGFHCLRHSFSGIISVEIDGHAIANIDIFGDWHRDTDSLLIIEHIGAGRHTLTIKMTDKQPYSSGYEFILKSIFIAGLVRATVSCKALSPPQTGLHEVRKSPCINLLSLADKNAGDQASSPAAYFSSNLPADRFDIFSWHPSTEPSFSKRMRFYETLYNSNVIIGGGGLLCVDWFAPALEFIGRSVRKLPVLWGPGHNSADPATWRTDFDEYNVSAANYGPIGVRDFGTRFTWVPCASCMSTELDIDYDIARPIGFVIHEHNHRTREQLSKGFENVPIISNYEPLPEIIKFIKQSDLIVTDSFHAAYWSVLSQRRVIAIPTSSKFFSFKHPVPLSDTASWTNMIGSTHIYNEALEDCRRANIDFAKSVSEYTEMPFRDI